jgi:DNA-binding transcriptional MerR regulator
MNEQIEQIETIDQLKVDLDKQADTAKKIRYLKSAGYSVKDIYHLLKKYNVTTKHGGEIRYQHVRNTVMMKLSN